jgi:oligoribonuclease NrnB/cAMP/cGMP phosphodiesterase (DHH superfamily)
VAVEHQEEATAILFVDHHITTMKEKEERWSTIPVKGIHTDP